MSLSRRAIGVGAICIAAFSGTVIAAPAASRKGLTKVAIKYLFKQPDASASVNIVGDDAVLLAEYNTYSLLAAPVRNVDRIVAAASAAGAVVEVHDEYDLLALPGGTTDTRLGVLSPPGAELIARYSKATFGLYVLQFLGPPKAEWLSGITKVGGTLVEPIPLNGYLAALTPEMAEGVAALPYVQFLDIHQPFQKAVVGIDRSSPGEQDVIIQLADAPGVDEAIKNIVAQIGPVAESKHGGRFISGRLHSQDVSAILSMPLVIGIHRLTTLGASDERQAMSLTSNVTTTVGPTGDVNTIPTASGGTYASWLTGPSSCNVCGSLSNEGFAIGIADSGVDDGVGGAHHLDLRPTNRIRYGQVFLKPTDAQGNCPTGAQPENVCESPTVCLTCDGQFHGTFVAGVAAGNAGTNRTDISGSGFLLGTGVAPTAGIFSTKIRNSDGVVWAAHDIFDWAGDATSNGVFVQNHSQNEYNTRGVANGNYTLQSFNFDRAVRNSHGIGTPPIALTVSAGNQHQDPVAEQVLLLPPATAKNVIAVGAAENVRPTSELKNCTGWIATSADSYNNIDADSKHGTHVAVGAHSWDTYAKPDLHAPASQIVSTRNPFLAGALSTTLACFGYGANSPNFDPDYFIISGTSFSAPVGAGAALIASRIYAATLPGVPNPAAASPALLKAMLIGGARSMRGGFDRATSPTAVIGPRPNAIQGFGRISLVDIVSHTPQRQYFNQAHTFTETDRQWSTTYSVDDPTKPVKVVLVWTDAPAPVQSDSTSVPTLLQNDLDLSVNIGGSTNCQTYRGNNMMASTRMPTEGEESILYSCGNGSADTKNNAELVVFFPDQGTTQFTVVVDARIINGSAIPDTNCPGNANSDCLEQDFALFVYNAASCAAPSITSQPQSVSVPAGSQATLSVGATGTALTYQWYVGASGVTTTPVGGGTGASVNVTPSSTTSYWVRVSNSCGSANSTSATVTVTCTVPPSIATQPQSVAVPAGTGVTLSVGVAGTSPTYQWFEGATGVTTTPVVGGTGASVDVTPPSTKSYWVRVTNSCGTANSTSAIVTVQPIVGADFFPLSPCRMLDTRGGGAIPQSGTINVPLIGNCGVPAGTTALAVNITAVNPQTIGFVTVYPGPPNTVRPDISTINYKTNRTLANNARVTLGTDGSINLYNAADQPLDVLIDVSGYFK